MGTVERVGGWAKKPSGLLTRPANTTAYTIGDEVGTAGTAPLSIAIARSTAGTGFILGARIVYAGYPATVPDLALLVFNATVTLAGDNAQLSLSDTDAAKWIGTCYTERTGSGQYSAGAPVASGNLLIDMVPPAPIAFEAAAATTNLYFAVITLNAFTPITNSETLLILPDVERD